MSENKTILCPTPDIYAVFELDRPIIRELVGNTLVSYVELKPVLRASGPGASISLTNLENAINGTFGMCFPWID